MSIKSNTYGRYNYRALDRVTAKILFDKKPNKILPGIKWFIKFLQSVPKKSHLLDGGDFPKLDLKYHFIFPYEGLHNKNELRLKDNLMDFFKAVGDNRQLKKLHYFKTYAGEELDLIVTLDTEFLAKTDMKYTKVRNLFSTICRDTMAVLNYKEPTFLEWLRDESFA